MKSVVLLFLLASPSDLDANQKRIYDSLGSIGKPIVVTLNNVKAKEVVITFDGHTIKKCIVSGSRVSRNTGNVFVELNQNSGVIRVGDKIYLVHYLGLDKFAIVPLRK